MVLFPMWKNSKKEGIQEYQEEMQCICKKDKTNQEERILESKCKTAITELEQLKDNTKKQKQKNKDIERKYISKEEVNG